MADALPRNTTELLSLIDQEWNALVHVVERLTPQQMDAPDAGGWSPKDNLAHLSAWMRYMQDSYLHKMPGHEAWGIDPEKWKHLDENGINAVLFERNRDRPAAEVLAGLRSTYEDIVLTLKTMPFEDLMKPLRESGPDTRLVIESVLGNTSDHFREHRQTIEKGL
ncbi:MAG TPA: ClbS/DfsB family four-helix bundle protein [Anaerolineales bacterium]